MSNWWLLISVPLGLHELHKRNRLARALYTLRDAAADAADALHTLRAAADAITTKMYTPTELREVLG